MVHKALKHHLKNVLDKGFSIAIVADGASSFAYSVGLAAHGLPDVIVCLPDPRKAAVTVSHYAHHVIEKNQFYGRSTDLFDNIDGGDLPVYVKPLHHTEELMAHVGLAFFFYEEYPRLIKQGHDPDFVQLLVADANNHLPFEEGYNHTRLPQKEFIGLMVA